MSVEQQWKRKAVPSPQPTGACSPLLASTACVSVEVWAGAIVALVRVICGVSSVRGILQVRIQEWIAIPFSRESSQPRDQTQVSCIAGIFLTIQATREALNHISLPLYYRGFPGGSEVKASACNAGDLGSIPRSGRSPGERNGNPLQYSCLENPMDGGAWWATVHGVAKSWTWLSDFTFTWTFFGIAFLFWD